MATYSYKFENDVYRLYEDGQPMSTQKGHPIITANEALAQKLVDDLRRGKTFASDDSLLAYHYTYCNMVAEHTLDELVAHYSESMNYANLIDDCFLMFRQSAPVRQTVAAYFAENASDFFRSMNYYQFAAFVILGTISDSWMFPYYVVSYLVEQIGQADYDEEKEQFVHDVVQYQSDTLDIDPHSPTYGNHLQHLRKTIDVFVEYFTME